MEKQYILKSSCIFNSIDDEPAEGAVLVRGNRIAGIYSGSELDDLDIGDAEVIDFGDRTIMPGFIDSHTHTGNFMEMADPDYCVDVSGAKTFAEVMDIIRAFGERSSNKLLYAINFNLFDLEEEVSVDADLIDSYLDDRPVIIMTWDCHTWYANSAAVEASGADAGFNGVFNDTEAYPLQVLLMRPLDERKKSLTLFLSKLNKAGITTVGDVFPYGITEPYTLYKAMDDDGLLTARICFYPPLLDTEKDEIESFMKEYDSDLLKFSGLKAILDGVLTVHTAWMLEPYSNKDTCGGPVIDKELMREKLLKACSMGIGCRIHAIGDAAIRFSLDCYEDALEKYGPIDRRHTIEHIEYCDPADVPRFGKLGVVADMHPRHMIFYIDGVIDYLGEEREKHTWLIRDIMDAGGVIGTGSDYPVVDFDPMLGIHAAITRTDDNGHPEGGWHPEQKLTLPEILRIYTVGSAMAMNIEKETGTLEEGKSADITVLDRNIFKAGKREILDIKPVMTMTAGKIVYRKQ